MLDIILVKPERTVVNPDGQIFQLMDDENKEALIEELKLISIPDEELSTVLNMDEIERKNWYKERKRQFKQA